MKALRSLIAEARTLVEDDAHLFSNMPVGVPKGKWRSVEDEYTPDGHKIHVRGGSSHVQRYYEKCIASSTAAGKDNPKSYCAAVAWTIWNKHGKRKHEKPRRRRKR